VTYLSKDKNANKLISQNKKAYHEYFIEETFQAGIELVGTEVKSLRAGKCNMRDSYVKIINNEAFVENLHISPYEKGNIFNKDPLRSRKLLLNRKEINSLIGSSATDGYTIVPTKIYFVRSYVKIDIGLAKGKKLYDKRQSIANKDQQREAEKEFKVRNLNF
jgi:SsrA-binding protein